MTATARSPLLRGTDLTPVVAHSLRAERMALIRDGLTTVLMIVFLFTVPWVVVSWMFILLPLALLTLPGSAGDRGWSACCW
nr:hypothetical protein GCM10020093_105830 [Planobispora longispora]